MINTNPRFKADLIPIEPIGIYTYAIASCPRCGANIGISNLQASGFNSIICKHKFPTGDPCNGHYYYRNGALEFVGTVP